MVKKKSAKLSKGGGSKPKPSGGNPPEVVLLPTVKRAVSVIAELLVHFGSGYASEAAGEIPPAAPPPQDQPPKPVPVFPALLIFEGVKVLQKFQVLLLASSFKNRNAIDWNSGPHRLLYCKMSFLHGMYARRMVKASGLSSVNDKIMKDSFDLVHIYCPTKIGGGGPTCEFDL